MARTKRKENALLSTAPATPAKAPYRAGGYVRLSVEDSGKPGADTIKTQGDLVQSYIKGQPDMEFCGLYCDNGRTGTNFERPAFEQLLAEVRTGKINCIVVKDLSRFGRNYKETGNFLERVFPFLGVRFIAVEDSFDTLTAQRNEYGFVVPLKNLMNENYSRDTSKKISTAIAAKERQGEFIGVWAPYGYSKSEHDGHKLVVNADTAPVVREIFSMRLSGMGYERIARELNGRGVPSPSAYLFQKGLTKNEKYRDTFWRAWNIKEILCRPVYLGHLVQGKRTQQAYKQAREERYAPENEWRVVHNTHEAMIDEASFHAAQDLARERKDAYTARLNQNGSVKTDNLFRGLVYCADCGKALSRRQLTSNWRNRRQFYYSFLCLTALSNPSACTRKNLSEEALTAVVSQQIRCHLQTVTELEAAIHREFTTKTANDTCLLAAKIVAEEKELARQRGLNDGLYQSLVDGIVTRQEYDFLKTTYLRRCEESGARLDGLQGRMRELERLTPQNPIFVALREFQGMEHLTEELIHALISRIEFGAENEIKIFFTYQSELERLKRSVEGVTVV